MNFKNSIPALLNIILIAAFLYFCNHLEASDIIVTVVFYWLGSIIHLTAHEIGHFIGGIVSGYKLLRLQLGPINILKNDKDRIVLSIGTKLDGQCIMIPKKVGSVHFIAYNMGGVYANLIVMVLSFLLLWFDSFYLALLFVESFLLGARKILVNLIPHKSSSIPNDGYIVRLLKRNKSVQKDYAIYLNLYEKMFLNERIDPQDYVYEREIADRDDELLYYNEIQDILRTYSVARQTVVGANR